MRADTRLMKQLNINTLRRVLSEQGQATKPQLAGLTGLSVVTVNALIAEMLEQGEVREMGMVPSGGGRPSMQYGYHYGCRTMAVIYGHQLEGRNYIHTLVTDLKGQKLWEHQDYMEDIQAGSFDAILDAVFTKFENIGLIAFGLPGEAIGEVVTINDFAGLEGADFLPRIRVKYGVPVLFENDINAMAYGYYRKNCGKDVTSLVGIYFPRTFLPGAGLILDGNIYYGNSHFAGEMGAVYVPVPWEELDYYEESQVLCQLEALLTSFACIVAPSCFVLYGDFFTDGMAEALERYVCRRLYGKFQVRVEVSCRLEEDYETGMVCLAQKKMRQLMEEWITPRNEEGKNGSERKNACGPAL